MTACNSKWLLVLYIMRCLDVCHFPRELIWQTRSAVPFPMNFLSAWGTTPFVCYFKGLTSLREKGFSGESGWREGTRGGILNDSAMTLVCWWGNLSIIKRFWYHGKENPTRIPSLLAERSEWRISRNELSVTAVCLCFLFYRCLLVCLSTSCWRECISVENASVAFLNCASHISGLHRLKKHPCKLTCVTGSDYKMEIPKKGTSHEKCTKYISIGSRPHIGINILEIMLEIRCQKGHNDIRGV